MREEVSLLCFFRSIIRAVFGLINFVLILAIILLSFLIMAKKEIRTLSQTREGAPMDEEATFNLEERVLFEKNSDVIKYDESKEIIDQYYNYLVMNPSDKIIIAGYKSPRETAQFLAIKRAASVARTLGKMGISSNRIYVVDYSNDIGCYAIEEDTEGNVDDYSVAHNQSAMMSIAAYNILTVSVVENHHPLPYVY